MQPKGDGGLGLRKLEAMSKACFMKLIWSLLNNSQELWCNVLKGLYLEKENQQACNFKSKDSSLWRAMYNLMPYIRCTGVWSIGTGEKTNVCEDCWIAPGLCITDVVTNIPESLFGYRVQQLTGTDGEWDWSLFHGWLPADLRNRIMAIIPPNQNGDEDKFFLDGTGNGNYSVKTMYQALTEENSLMEIRHWEVIWKL